MEGAPPLVENVNIVSNESAAETSRWSDLHVLSLKKEKAGVAEAEMAFSGRLALSGRALAVFGPPAKSISVCRVASEDVGLIQISVS